MKRFLCACLVLTAGVLGACDGIGKRYLEGLSSRCSFLDSSAGCIERVSDVRSHP